MQHKLNIKPQPAHALSSIEGLLSGLPADPSEADVQIFMEARVKEGADKVQRNKIIDALVKSVCIGRGDLNKMWKAAEKAQQKPKDCGLYFLDVCADVDKRIEYAERRIDDTNGVEPYLLHRGGSLVQISRNEEGVARIQNVSKDRFAHHLNNVCMWKKSEGESERKVHTPEDVVKHLYHGPLDGYPPLTRLTTVPTFTKAKLLTVPGYQDGIYYSPPPGFQLPPLPAKPETSVTEQCLEDLADLSGDIPLDGMTREESSQARETGEETPSFAHWLSYGLSSVARDLIDGPVPGHLARKDKPRSGATLAMTVMEEIATCQPCAPQTLPDRDEETQKALMSGFLEGGAYILYDNIKGGKELESDTLAAAMTAYPRYKGRLLGANKMATVPANAVFGFTGNRSALSPQLAERMLLIDIDPKMENPGSRSPSSFKHDMRAEVNGRKGHYLWCLLVLIQNWIAKGCPEWQGTPLGGFERHAAVVGGILEAAGVKGFMANRKKLDEMVKSDDPVNEFMDTLVSEHESVEDEQYVGTLFRVGSSEIELPKCLEHDGKLPKVVSIPKLLEDAQVAMDGFGYQKDYEGVISYPKASERKVAQRLQGLVGAVREHTSEHKDRRYIVENKRAWRLSKLDGLNERKIGKLYKLELTETESRRRIPIVFG